VTRLVLLAALVTCTAAGAAGPAAPLVLSRPSETQVAPDGRLLVGEQGRNRIVAVDPATGKITVLARIQEPFGLARAASGELYVSSGRRLARIGRSGAVRTVARVAADVGPVEVAPSGDVFFAATDDRVYRLRPATGAVTAVAGNGRHGAAGDGGPALKAELGRPHGIAVAHDGTLLLADTDNGRIRRIDSRTGVVSTIARGLTRVTSVAVAADGSVYVAQPLDHRVRRVGRDGRLSVVAGTGQPGSTGDGGPARRAAVDAPAFVAVGRGGVLYVVESVTGLIRRVAPDGTITTVRGA
jgi:sugar lactone lactonase YvrE